MNKKNKRIQVDPPADDESITGIDFNEIFNKAGDTPETFTTIVIPDIIEPVVVIPDKKQSTSVPGPKKLTSIPNRTKR